MVFKNDLVISRLTYIGPIWFGILGFAKLFGFVPGPHGGGRLKVDDETISIFLVGALICTVASLAGLIS